MFNVIAPVSTGRRLFDVMLSNGCCHVILSQSYWEQFDRKVVQLQEQCCNSATYLGNGVSWIQTSRLKVNGEEDKIYHPPPPSLNGIGYANPLLSFLEVQNFEPQKTSLAMLFMRKAVSVLISDLVITWSRFKASILIMSNEERPG